MLLCTVGFAVVAVDCIDCPAAIELGACFRTETQHCNLHWILTTNNSTSNYASSISKSHTEGHELITEFGNTAFLPACSSARVRCAECCKRGNGPWLTGTEQQLLLSEQVLGGKGW